MSQAFVREGDEQSLSEIAPTLNALINFLTNENGGIRVYEKEKMILNDGREASKMSNGLSYAKGSGGRWEETTEKATKKAKEEAKGLKAGDFTAEAQ